MKTLAFQIDDDVFTQIRLRIRALEDVGEKINIRILCAAFLDQGLKYTTEELRALVQGYEVQLGRPPIRAPEIPKRSLLLADGLARSAALKAAAAQAGVPRVEDHRPPGTNQGSRKKR